MKILLTLNLLFIYTIFFCAVAQDISVKYRGIVDVDNGHFTEYSLKPSSVVKQIYYDEKNQYLLVRLKGTFYHYCSITNAVVSKWIGASSLGKFYYANVKGNYDCRINPTPEY